MGTHWSQLWDMSITSSYYSWACSSAVSRESKAFWPSFWRESVYVSNILMFWLFCCTSDSFYQRWGIAQPMDALTKVTRWEGRTYRGRSITLSIAFLIWHHWTFEHALLQKNCLSSLLLLLIITQIPHFHALSHGNCWTAGSTAITAILASCESDPHSCYEATKAVAKKAQKKILRLQNRESCWTRSLIIFF